MTVESIWIDETDRRITTKRGRENREREPEKDS